MEKELGSNKTLTVNIGSFKLTRTLFELKLERNLKLFYLELLNHYFSIEID